LHGPADAWPVEPFHRALVCLPQQEDYVTKKFRLSLFALMTISFASFARPAAAGAADDDRSAPKALVLPLSAVGNGGVTFNGTVAVQRFVERDGQLFAIGAVSGTLYGPAGPMGTSIYLPVAFPVHISNGLIARAERGAIHPASMSVRDYGARVIFAQASTCGVLHLALGAVNLNLLGAAVTTTPVTIDINGDTAGPLGNLVCTALSTLNNVVGVVKLLNSILGLVTGLLGGLTGGLGGAVPM
jgi:hypothetical protein